VHLLVNRGGADVNKQDKDRQTPLHLASHRQHLKLVQALLDHDANVNAEDINGRNPLHRVIEGPLKSGDGVSIVRLLARRGADVNIRDKHHLTPLHVASYRQHLKSVRVLLDLGASFSAEDSQGRTPLHHVLEGPFISEDGAGVVQLLVKRGAEVNTPDNNDITPLHIASYRRKLKSVRVLLNLGADINAEDSQGRTPLHQVFGDESIHEDSFSVVRLLVERGANVNAPDKHHLTPLHFASYRQHLESVRVLLNRGAHVNAEDSQGRTPLQQVFEGNPSPKDSVGVVQLLVERGANVNTQDRHHQTPLHFASYRQHLESVWVLLNHRANVDAEDSQGQTPLHRVLEAPSIFEDGVHIVRLLAERGTDVNTQRNKDHMTPLHLASHCQHRKLVCMLLNLGANVHAENSQGLTPLHQVFEDPYIYKDGVDIVQLLAERGRADVNARNNVLETPLHLASHRQRPKSVRMLLDHGANVNAENSQGRTPLHRALEGSYVSKDGIGVIQLLVEHGADVNILDKGLITALHLASHRQHLESVHVLIDHGANVNAEDSQGRTPLHQVLGSSYISEDGVGVVQLLVERGANVNTRDKYRITPLHSASYRVYLQHDQSVRQLLDRGANENAEENWARTPFHPVLDNRPQDDPGKHIIPELLMEHGADVNARDEENETPLHLVSRLGLFERAWVLLEHGADRNVENKEGKIPFQVAQESITEEMRRKPLRFFNKSTIAERVVLMGLLYGS
jgi:ankyrin